MRNDHARDEARSIGAPVEIHNRVVAAVERVGVGCGERKRMWQNKTWPRIFLMLREVNLTPFLLTANHRIPRTCAPLEQSFAR